ncbi:hypothetical protein SKAU_G00388540 [Synaphobranchus kaupii]|uniref:Uncharacterized protein n=1 Tax=Synaphobranchus kaupii TaxID=118154 RepID=A0A9Q1EB54_SYNKA|nr:hypothetical protein SKAU_G00388540 [Synaphobranchus kaupii]
MREKPEGLGRGTAAARTRVHFETKGCGISVVVRERGLAPGGLQVHALPKAKSPACPSSPALKPNRRRAPSPDEWVTRATAFLSESAEKPSANPASELDSLRADLAIAALRLCREFELRVLDSSRQPTAGGLEGETHPNVPPVSGSALAQSRGYFRESLQPRMLLKRLTCLISA